MKALFEPTKQNDGGWRLAFRVIAEEGDYAVRMLVRGVVVCGYCGYKEINNGGTYGFRVVDESEYNSWDEVMAKAEFAKKTTRKYERTCQQFGTPRDFAVYSAYMLRAMGVETIVTKKNGGEVEWKVSDVGYVVESFLASLGEP